MDSPRFQISINVSFGFLGFFLFVSFLFFFFFLRSFLFFLNVG